MTPVPSVKYGDARQSGYMRWTMFAVTIVLSAGFAAQLVNRVGVKPVLVAGMALVAYARFSRPAADTLERSCSRGVSSTSSMRSR